MIARLACISLALFALSGCGTHQTVKPVERLGSKTVCIIDNKKAAQPIREIFERVLVGKGYEVRVLAEGASLGECPLTATYAGTWRYLQSFHLSLADIIVYKNSRQVGSATYKVDSDSSVLSQMASGNKKIAELTEQLFPDRAGL
ncbi:Sbal_3080 family lipoprotein [Massilia pseudoviolaceinigra]|uniref:Sbal_3080 family lipoprotein n=1 Tax=Massilia pseudoviolaceinigra TaxID=3057165 RepID=UPI002796A170|nr:Sbal_3080 family lipoprotein [Massilia sp. CCM 9206]MDQ1920592.1 Sbal_3080 family lipoprotein [Massilia sp. CCM 9206]